MWSNSVCGGAFDALFFSQIFVWCIQYYKRHICIEICKLRSFYDDGETAFEIRQEKHFRFKNKLLVHKCWNSGWQIF